MKITRSIAIPLQVNNECVPATTRPLLVSDLVDSLNRLAATLPAQAWVQGPPMVPHAGYYLTLAWEEELSA